MRFFDNVTGTQKVILLLVVILIAVRIIFPDVAQWAFDGIREMTRSIIDLMGGAE